MERKPKGALKNLKHPQKLKKWSTFDSIYQVGIGDALLSIKNSKTFCLMATYISHGITGSTCNSSRLTDLFNLE